MMKIRALIFLLIISMFGAACGTDDAESQLPADEWGRTLFDPTGDEEIAPTKDDAVTGQRGLPVSVDTASTAVWEVKNAWEDTNTAAARAAGIAWGENSGLNWDQKYQAWINSMPKTQTEGGYSRDTFMLKTPWGVELPAPALECAEVAIFLRVAFASWYNLPFFMEARDREGRIYFGHFGMRRDSGKYGSMPDFKTRYRDYSDRALDVMAGGDWPTDPDLAKKKIPGSFDDAQPMIGPDAHAGAYFDRVFLNKRTGHFLSILLAYFGSVNLADPSNTFNIKAEAVQAGDVLVDRWQAQGIGHVMVVVRRNDAGQKQVGDEMIPQIEAELASGSMPRRQPVWESPGSSKYAFTKSSTGGEGYEANNGGIKRWRTAKNVGGSWTNVVPATHTRDWINSTDKEAIAARPERFKEILVELSPDQKRDVLLETIEARRQHLQQYPASCSARIKREEAFDAFYVLMKEEFNMDPATVDAEYRTLADYVFAELDYGSSKTCCWNRSTSNMYEIAMDYNVKLQETQCTAPVVFMNRDDAGDGYDLFRQHAIELGRGDQWVAWSADESCPQAGVAVDTIVESDVADYCSIASDLPEDPVDPVQGEALDLEFSGAGAIPDNDPAGLSLSASTQDERLIAEASVFVDITHSWRGDLSITLVHPDGTREVIQEANPGDSEDNLNIRLASAGLVGKSAAGAYELIVIDNAGSDTGSVVKAVLELKVAE